LNSAWIRARNIDRRPKKSEKLKVPGGRVAFIMDDEEVARLYCMRELKILAKKYGIVTRRVKKIDIVKAFPPELLAELKSR
jgi:hypothetical protein